MPHSDKDALLAGRAYDKDASEVNDDRMFSQEESDSDNDTLVHSPDRKDEDVFEEHDEAERLLSEAKGLSGAVKKSKLGRSRRSRRSEEMRRQAEGSSSASLMYEMEEGYKDTSSTSSRESLLLAEKHKTSAHSGISRKTLIVCIVGVLASFVLLSFGSYQASKSSRSTRAVMFNNGTHAFAPTTILISLDGFRADFLNRGLTPSMSAFIRSGVSPKYMLPSFPSVTFPNHYTLVTGMYPESHGIVGNTFWDPAWEEEFHYTNTTSSMQSKWWENAQPLWMTAEDQGVRTAVHMWPGSEAHIHGVDPTYLDKYNSLELLPNKVNRILELLDMELDKRPQLLAAYVPNVDADGHLYGPNSTEIRGTIAEADQMLTLLLEGLLDRNLTEIVNLVIVSDHGMATTHTDRMIQLDDLINMDLVDHLDGWPLRGLRLKNPVHDIPAVYANLSEAASKYGTFDVYTRETMPDRYHFSKNDRIAPIWVVPQTGWMVVENDDFDLAEARETGKVFHPIGLHGFDHEHPLMRAIFIARGPAFPHQANSRLAPFQNIEVYNIICDSLGIEPHNNNGTLRLPLKPIGLHSDFDEPALELDDSGLNMIDDDQTVPASHGSEQEDHTSVPSDQQPDQQVHDPEPTSDAQSEDEHNSNISDEKKSDWWKYLHDQLDKAKEWAKEFIDSIKNNKPTGEKTPG